MRIAAPLALALLLLLVVAFLWWDRGAADRHGDLTATASGSPVTTAPAPAAPSPAKTAVAGREEAAPGRTFGPRPAARGLRVQVLDSGGAPMTGAAVLALQAEVLLDRRETGADGWTDLNSSTGAGWLLALAPGHAGYWEPATLAPGERVLRLPAGAELAGLVTVDGAPPGQSVALRLDYAEAPAELPPELLAALQSAGVHGLEHVRGACDTQGAFRFSGLPAGFHGQLVCAEEGFLHEEQDPHSWEDPAVSVEQPRTDLVLRLKRIPLLRGRVRAADGGPPPAGTRVTLMMRYVNRSTSTGRNCDDDGNFSFRVRDPEVNELRLEVHAPEAPGFERTLDPIPADWDVGDIQLPELYALKFLVVDPAQQPLAGAQVSADDGKGWSAATGGDGAGQLLVPFADVALVARAVGFLSLPCPVAAGDLGPVLVRMRPANVLRVRVRGPDGTALTGVRVAIETDGPILEGDDGLERIAQRVQVGVMQGASWSPERMMLSFAVDGRGEFALTGVRAGAVVTLEVLPAAGAPLLREQLPPMPPSGEVLREVAATMAVQEFRGRVTDELGRPIAQAEVRIEGGDENLILVGEQARTGPDGRFRFAQVHGPAVHLVIKADDFLPHEVPAFALPAPAVESEFQLRRGRRFDLHLQDEAGAGIAAGAWAQVGDSWQHAQRMAPGHLSFRGVPHAEFDIQIQCDAGSLLCRAPAAGDRMLLTVPAFGAVEFRLPEGMLADAGDYLLVAWAADGSYRSELAFQLQEQLRRVSLPGGPHRFEVRAAGAAAVDLPLLGPITGRVRSGEIVMVSF